MKVSKTDLKIRLLDPSRCGAEVLTFRGRGTEGTVSGCEFALP